MVVESPQNQVLFQKLILTKLIFQVKYFHSIVHFLFG